MDTKSEKLNLLFVDDEKRILMPLKAMFRSEYNVFTTTNPHDVLNIIENEHLHIIVSDHRMPEMTGTELLKEVRERSPKTIRILLTGYADLQSIMGAVNSSEVFRFVQKPWDDAHLKKTISAAAELARELMSLKDEQLLDMPAIEDSEDHLESLDTTKEKDVSLLVIDSGEEIHTILSELFNNQYNILYTKDLEGAFLALEKYENIALLMVDVKPGDTDINAFIHALKKNYPLIPILVSTPEADAEAIVQLINEGQIYRYLPKPLKRGMLKLAIEAAYNRYKNYYGKTNLAFLAKQKVEDSKDTMIHKFMDRMKFLKQRLDQILH